MYLKAVLKEGKKNVQVDWCKKLYSQIQLKFTYSYTKKSTFPGHTHPPENGLPHFRHFSMPLQHIKEGKKVFKRHKLPFRLMRKQLSNFVHWKFCPMLAYKHSFMSHRIPAVNQKKMVNINLGLRLQGQRSINSQKIDKYIINHTFPSYEL